MTASPNVPALERAWFLQCVKDRGKELVNKYEARAIGVGKDKTGRLAVRFYVRMNWVKPSDFPAGIPFKPPGVDEVMLPTCIIPTAEEVRLQRTGR